MQAGVGGVVVLPVWVGRVATMLREAGGVSTTAAVGFPLGGSKSTVKAIEATSCVKDGAEGLWVVPHLPNLLREKIEIISQRVGVGPPGLVQQSVSGHRVIVTVSQGDLLPEPAGAILIVRCGLSAAAVPIPVAVRAPGVDRKSVV